MSQTLPFLPAHLHEIRVVDSFDAVWQRLTDKLAAANIPVFTTILHSEGAEKAGLFMPATRVIVFGNPLVGTHLMLAAPALALELPLRMAVRQDGEECVVWWADMADLATRYGIAKDHEIVQKLQGLLAMLAQSAAGK